MDLADIAEEEKRLREEQELKELEESVFGSHKDGEFISERDLLGKGKDVIPTGKQMKILHTIASQLKVSATVGRSRPSRRFSSGFNATEIDNEAVMDSGIRDFELTSKPRILITNVLLITTRKDPNVESYDLEAVVWAKDMKLKYFNYDYFQSSPATKSTASSSTDDEQYTHSALSFEIISVKTRTRPQMSFMFVCDSDRSRSTWIEDIENVLLAYNRDTTAVRQLGWYHDIILGSIHSAAYTGDLSLLRKYLKALEGSSISVDIVDKSGMTALHWAVLRSQEVCTRLLLEYGADPDRRQRGQNNCLLLAAARGNDSLCRLLLDHGADVTARNSQDRGAIFMCVVFGHASKGLPWLLQMLNARGLDLNQIDKKGYSPLHLCAERNIVRPIRMLVDSGADVNARHERTNLTALQMACSNAHPDVETIRSFLDKGAYPNWKDLQGRTALDIVLQNQATSLPSSPAASSHRTELKPIPIAVASPTFDLPSSETESVTSSNDHRFKELEAAVLSSNGPDSTQTKWRQMENTLESVGLWAVKILPVILEIVKKGGRFNPRDFETLRPSFRAAITEAWKVWETKTSPDNFHDYVTYRQQSGEQLLLHKGEWTKDKASPTCQLCSEAFGMKNRRHHCRACGNLVCDSCSSKRMDLDGLAFPELTPSKPSQPAKVSSTTIDKSPLHRMSSGGIKKKEDRVCDGCFNRLCHEASQPSPEHFRVRQLRQCALDLVQSIAVLMEALDETDTTLDPIQRQTEMLTRSLDDLRMSMNSSKSIKLPTTPNAHGSYASPKASGSFNSPSNGTNDSALSSDEVYIDTIKRREEKLSNCEDIAKKFTEVADGYHRVSKRIIEQRLAASRLWGNGDKATG